MEYIDMLKPIEPAKSIFALFFLLSNRLETIGNSFLGEITSKQWFMMAAVTTCFSVPPSIGEVAACVGLSHQNVKKIAARLEEKGFLKLEKDSSDRRVLRLKVTEKAFQYEQKSQAKNERFLKDLFSGFNTSEQKDLLTALHKLMQQLEFMNRIRKDNAK